jgi:outer membrane protein OmpA-like peptidoglycan-associated protein
MGRHGKSSRYDLTPLPGKGLEAGWWAAISTTTAPEAPDRPRQIEINVPSDVLFDEGSSDLVKGADQKLASVARDIISEASGPVTIFGFTDQVGAEQSNLELGQRRADTVAETLIAHGVPRSQIAPTQSKGEGAPLCVETRADGTDDADCRARDRRVFITYTITTTP